MHAPVLTALGWLLLNSLWQFALAWLLYRVLTWLIPGCTAKIRHQLALVILILTLIGGFVFSYRFYPGTGFPTIRLPKADSNPMLLNLSNQLIALTGLLWMACMVWQTFRLLRSRHSADELAKQSAPLQGRWKLYVHETAALLGIHRPVQLLVTAKAVSVQASGWLKPVIILPLATLNSLSVAQMEAVLLHELVHIRQHDYLVNLLLAACDWLFFFNPFLRLFTQAIRREREFRCDDMVLQFRYHAPDYAAALLQLARTQSHQLVHALPATGNSDQQLLQRIQRMLGLPQKASRQRYTGALLALLIGGLILIGAGAENAGPVTLPGLLNPVLADNTQTPFTSGTEHELTIKLQKPAQATASSQKILSENKKPRPDQTTGAVAITPSDDLVLEAVPADPILYEANNKKTIEFTMDAGDPAYSTVTDPAPAALEKPFVPSQSFSYNIIEDADADNRPAIVLQNAATQKAKSAARLTTEEKQALQRELRYSNADLVRLQQTIADLAIQSTNTATEKAAPAMSGQTLQLFETLERQLAEKEQLIRILQQRLENAAKDYTEQEKLLQRTYKLRRIIHI